jgi:folate-dependent phosphoribosylglycinamide formyltransferase PurN
MDPQKTGENRTQHDVFSLFGKISGKSSVIWGATGVQNAQDGLDVNAFEDRIINIHPALLPKFGGKGMYGHFVHEAVHEANEIESGITVHLVNEEFDKGEILFQAKANVENCSAAEIEQKVRALEIEHFPKVIENFISKM